MTVSRVRARASARSFAARRRIAPWVLGSALVLVVSVLIGLTIGPASSAAVPAPPLTAGQVLGSAWHHVAGWLSALGLPVDAGASPLSPIREAIVWQGRAPRLFTAALVGAGLALAGAVMQSVTRNPLADPYLLGVSSGATVGAVAVLLLGASLALPVAAFLGAAVALALTLALGGSGGGTARMVLAGVAVAQAGGALTSFLIFSTARGDSYREILGWLMGRVAGATWSSVAIAAVAVAAGGTVLLASARTLDAFAFGDSAAAALGVRVRRSRWLLLGVTALLTGALVSVSGSIGFVGLVLPHVVRLLVGTRHGAVLPLAALGGAIFLVWADTAARTVFAPMELPVGVLTAAIGAPLFAWLLVRRRAGAS